MSDLHKADWPSLICTRCGGGLYIELIDEGGRIDPPEWSHRVVDCVACEKCGAEWDQKGEPRDVAWLATLEEEASDE